MKKQSLILLSALSFFFIPINLSASKSKPFKSTEEADNYLTLHYNLGSEYYNAGEWRKASNEFEKVIYFFSSSQQAAEASYYLAISYYEMKEFDFSNEEFSNYLKASQNPTFFEDAVFYKFCIAEHFKHGKKKRPFKMRYLPKWISGQESALTIYDEVVAALPNHDLAVSALWSKGELLKQMKEYRDAVEAYQMIIKRFPKHELVPECYEEISKAFYALSKGEFQNPDLIGLAELNVKKFKENFPKDERAKNLERYVERIKEMYAKGLCDLGLFYLRLKQPEAAAIYFQSAIEEFPETQIAVFCRSKLISLGFQVSDENEELEVQNQIGFDPNSKEINLDLVDQSNPDLINDQNFQNFDSSAQENIEHSFSAEPGVFAPRDEPREIVSSVDSAETYEQNFSQDPVSQEPAQSEELNSSNQLNSESLKQTEWTENQIGIDHPSGEHNFEGSLSGQISEKEQNFSQDAVSQEPAQNEELNYPNQLNSESLKQTEWSENQIGVDIQANGEQNFEAPLNGQIREFDSNVNIEHDDSSQPSQNNIMYNSRNDLGSPLYQEQNVSNPDSFWQGYSSSQGQSSYSESLPDIEKETGIPMDYELPKEFLHYSQLKNQDNRHHYSEQVMEERIEGGFAYNEWGDQSLPNIEKDSSIPMDYELPKEYLHYSQLKNKDNRHHHTEQVMEFQSPTWENCPNQ